MSRHESGSEPLRLAILASPRMGNSWFRHLLVSLYGVTEIAVHDPQDIPWDSLPPRVVLNIHWLPEPEFVERLGGFRVLTLARHPLDTLISILHFAPYRPDTNRWLLGLGGDEDAIRGKAPTSPEFFGYAVGARSAALFSVSRRWWDRPGVIGVRYEDLLADGVGTMGRVAREIAAPTVRPVEEAVAACSIDALRTRARHYLHHMWKGQPGQWRELVPPRVARAVADAHADYCRLLGYPCDPDESLTDAQADANWLAADAETNRRDGDQLWTVIEATRAAAAETQARLHASLAQLAAAQSQLRESEARRDDSEGRLTEARARLEETHARLEETQARLGESESQAAATQERLNESQNRLAATQARLERSEDQLTETRSALDEANARIADLRGRLADLDVAWQNSVARLADTARRLAGAEARLAGTGPTGLAVARRLSRLSARFPRTAQGAKRVLGSAGDRRAA